MADKIYELDGFSFSSEAELARAKKEKETIDYMKKQVSGDNIKELLKIYNKAVSKGAFQTIYGYMYLAEIRQILITKGGIDSTMLGLVPVKQQTAEGAGVRLSTDASAKEVRRYKVLYEAIRDKNRILQMAVGFLLVIILVMLIITYRSRYSVFTYFTDYEQSIRTEVEDEYEQWSQEIQQREEAVEAKEKELGIDAVAEE